MTTTVRKFWRLTALIAAMAVVLIGCSGDDGSGTDDGTSSDDQAAADDGTSEDDSASGSADGDLSVYVIGGSGDPFFATVRRGFEDAKLVVESVGGSATYLALESYENLGPDTAQLIRTAISNNPDVISVPIWGPDAQNPAIAEAQEAGIEVFLYNAGRDQAETVGALGYIGSDDYLGGVAVGEWLAEQGSTHTLCVITVPGAVNHESRCDGVEDAQDEAGGQITRLPLPASNFGDPTAVTQAIKAELEGDDSYTSVVTLGGQDGTSAVNAVEQADLTDRVIVTTFDTNENVLRAIQDGSLAAAVDQQGYLQGFYATTAAYQYAAYGLTQPRDILTGPALITQENVESVVAGAEAGVR